MRDPGADRDGRYGWDVPSADGTVVRPLMPGVELPRLRDDITAHAPCLYLDGGSWRWSDALRLLASPARWGSSPHKPGGEISPNLT
ncbi:hypothetical protein KRM28CT15_44270 [Krasilnikovia sp. M28-CT-15]